jgi:ABC-type uncharacterized transport system auxiliary subunit
MKNAHSLIGYLLIGVCFIALTGCGILSQREYVSPNYYVLDYLSATENKNLIQSKHFDKTLEIMDTKLPRTYDRNQIVNKKSYSQISYFNNELWANKLYDAVPNILVQRLSAYNMFRKVSRDLGEVAPDYYLETYIQNIERIEGDPHQAFLRMEFYLRKTSDQSVVLTQKNERSQNLRDESIEYLVQTFNQMIMFETDIFAAKCLDLLSGKPPRDNKRIVDSINKFYNRFNTQAIEQTNADDSETGELLVPLKIQTEVPLPFVVAYRDTTNDQIEAISGYMNEILKLKPGKYNLSLGSEEEFSAPVEVLQSMRTVVEPNWGELLVRIIDQSQTRVRMQYDIYRKLDADDFFSERLGSRYSPGDEIGETDYIWVIKPGDYMITLQGVSPIAYKDFTTVGIEAGKSYVMTIVVDPQGGTSVMVGAGLLESSDSLAKIPFHKGAIHADINFSSNNIVDQNTPTRSLNLSGQFDNKLEYDIWPFHYITKSLYEIGFNKTTGSDFEVSVDDYAIKNSLVFFPWKKNKVLKNFGLYGRGDANTHFFPDYVNYYADTDFVRLTQDGEVIYSSGKRIQVTKPPYPLDLREGTGLTYRWNISPTISMNFRNGYGWRQSYQEDVYSYIERDSLAAYKAYEEKPTILSKGFESSIIITAINLLDFLSITSTLDVLYPKQLTGSNLNYYNENLINIKLYRNISLDAKANISYNKEAQDYIVLDYSAFLRLSLYY